jgi:L-2-hydroxyglutarate oxidase LhgO
MTDDLDCVVIGAGVIGLAVARNLALAGRQVVVLEAEAAVAMHTSSRNSEVIHAGIYYPQGSLKGRLCVEGRRQLYEYCAEHRIPHRRLGKLIVACDEAEMGMLQEYAASARGHGVTDLRPLSIAEVTRLEPAVRCRGGLLSPSTGIVDSHAFILALLADLEAAGGVVVCRSRVVHVDIGQKGFAVRLEGDDGAVSCATLINAAGLWASEVAASMRQFPPGRIPATYLAKGHYFSLQGTSPFGRLVYPVAGGGGLGVHVTLDTSGVARFGPDIAPVDSVDYGFDETRKGVFVEAIRRYYPDLQPDRLVPGYTGIRPKIVAPGQPPADFLIQGPDDHGVRGLVNLFGIESPGLTAALPLAETVARMLADEAAG